MNLSCKVVGNDRDAARMVRMRIQGPHGLQLLVVHNKDTKMFSGGELRGEEKARYIREQLERMGLALPPDRPLMDALGGMDVIVLCEETPNEWEVAIGHALALRLEFEKEEIVGEFRCHRALPETAHVKWASEAEEDAGWKKFDDSRAAQTTEDVPAWVQRLLDG